MPTRRGGGANVRRIGSLRGKRWANGSVTGTLGLLSGQFGPLGFTNWAMLRISDFIRLLIRTAWLAGFVLLTQ